MSLDGETPAEIRGDVVTRPATPRNFTWESIAVDCSNSRWQREYQFAMDRPLDEGGHGREEHVRLLARQLVGDRDHAAGLALMKLKVWLPEPCMCR